MSILERLSAGASRPWWATARTGWKQSATSRDTVALAGIAAVSTPKVGSAGEHSDARSSLVDEAITRTVSALAQSLQKLKECSWLSTCPAKAEWDRD